MLSTNAGARRLRPANEARLRGPSGFRGEPCLGCMRIVYLAVTTLAALLTGYAATLSFAGADPATSVADRLRISRRWMVPFGILLACGASGLLLGISVPLLGTAAAVGLILYFVCAVSAHLRAHDRQIGGAVFFLLLAVAALVINLTYRDPW